MIFVASFFCYWLCSNWLLGWIDIHHTPHRPFWKSCIDLIAVRSFVGTFIPSFGCWYSCVTYTPWWTFQTELLPDGLIGRLTDRQTDNLRNIRYKHPAKHTPKQLKWLLTSSSSFKLRTAWRSWMLNCWISGMLGHNLCIFQSNIVWNTDFVRFFCATHHPHQRHDVMNSMDAIDAMSH